MWSCASAALLHQLFLCTNRFVSVVPNRLASKQSKCLTLSERKPDHEFTVNTSSSESGSCTDTESEGLVTAEATAIICTVNLDQTKSPLKKAMKVISVPKKQSMFAFVGKNNLTESIVSERLDKTPIGTALVSKKTSYDAVYDAEKRRRQFVLGWNTM